MLEVLNNFANLLIWPKLREASRIDFVHEKRHIDVGGGGGWGVGACDVSR